MATINFIRGTWDKFKALSTYTANAVYFIYDKGRIYQASADGATAYEVAGNNVEMVSELPAASAAWEGRIYVKTDDGTVHAKVNDVMVQIGGGEATEIADGVITFSKFAQGLVVAEIGDEPSAEKVASEKAVADHVAAVKATIEQSITDQLSAVNTTIEGVEGRVDALEADDPIVDASAARAEDNSGTVIKFTTKKGAEKTVNVGDLFLADADYDASTHILTLTVQGGSTVEVDLAALIPEACSTSDVALSGDIVATVAVGNIAKGETLSKDMSVQALLLKLLSKDSLPTKTDPKVTLSGTDEFKAYEVGTQISEIKVSGAFSAGSYSQTAAKDQVSSGVKTVADTNGHVWKAECTGQTTQYADTAGSTGETFTFAGITVADDTNVVVKLTANHSAGATPKSYLGNDEVDGTKCSTKAITAGSKNASTSAITGFRYGWYGYKTAKVANPAALTASDIKALGNTVKNTGSLPTSLATNKMIEMFFAMPAGMVSDGAKNLSITSQGTGLPQTVKGPYKVSVGGVNDASPTDYYVYYVSNASADDGADTYSLSWS